MATGGAPLNEDDRQWADWNPTENSFYVVRPPDDDEVTPFYLVRCIKLDHKLQIGADEITDGAWVQFWAPKKWLQAGKDPKQQADLSKTLDYLSEPYQAEIPVPKKLPGNLTFLDKKCFQVETRMTGQGNTKTISNVGHNRNKIRGWASRWKGGADVESSDDNDGSGV